VNSLGPLLINESSYFHGFVWKLLFGETQTGTT